MNSNERRAKIIGILQSAIRPIKGSELAKDLSVSRQVIVQDIALIRAKGYEIIATPQGYMIYIKNNVVGCVECKNHTNDEEIYDEFKTIVNMGGKIKDVIVEHSTYGTIKVELNISTHVDIEDFIEKTKNNEFKQLSLLSEVSHIHTIEAESKELLSRIIQELKNKGILSE